MTTFSYVSTVLTQVNITKPCLIGGLSTGPQASGCVSPCRSWLLLPIRRKFLGGVTIVVRRYVSLPVISESDFICNTLFQTNHQAHPISRRYISLLKCEVAGSLPSSTPHSPLSAARTINRLVGGYQIHHREQGICFLFHNHGLDGPLCGGSVNAASLNYRMVYRLCTLTSCLSF
jgi:hypothetical protein